MSGILSTIYFVFHKSSTVSASLYIDNKYHQEIELGYDHRSQIDSLFTIEVNAGKLRIINSTCKNKVCIRQGWSEDRPIICVPNNAFIDFHKKQIGADEIFITK